MSVDDQNELQKTGKTVSVKARNNLSEIKRLNCGRRMSRLAKKGRVKGKDQ